jgi:hypothetical protein
VKDVSKCEAERIVPAPGRSDRQYHGGQFHSGEW